MACEVAQVQMVHGDLTSHGPQDAWRELGTEGCGSGCGTNSGRMKTSSGWARETQM